jgi:hypothetical protein
VYDNWPSLLVALLICGVLGLVLRWAFRPSRPRTGPIVDAAEAQNLGLLQVVSAALSRTEAVRRQAQLREAGIRASISARRDGRSDLLVFTGDYEKARLTLDA